MASIKPGKNDPCPCGSGKKYKKCCQEKFEAHSGVQPPQQKAEIAGKPGSLGNSGIGGEPNPQEIDALVAMFKQGRYAETEALARAMVERFPRHNFGWKAMGTALLQQGRAAEAVAPLQEATKLSPGDAKLHNNLGNTLAKLGRMSEAEASYRQALKLDPDFTEAHYNLGNALLELGRLPEAEASYRRALKLKPGFIEALNKLGNTLQALARFAEAEASYRQALQLRPGYAEAHSSLGITLSSQNRLPEAEASYRRALELNPDFAEAHSNLGDALCEQGRLAEAEYSLRRALEIKPDYAEVYNNLGKVLRGLQPNDAVACYRRALEIKPDFIDAYSNLLFTCNSLHNQPPAWMLADARRYGELVARQARPYKVWSNIPEPARCLRVGLVSGDLHEHPVGYFLESVLAALSAHAAGRLEFFAYPSRFRASAVTERIRACCRGWHLAVGFSDETLAQRIHDDGIDILIDLAGHTAYNRLPVFAWKPAPVQASWLGYFATTGVVAMDYFIADPWTVQETEEAHFTEKIWRLPETYLCFTAPDADVKVTPLPALTNNYITFGCFNNLTKMNDVVVALWARVLHAVPGSRLFLKTRQLNDATAQQGVAERFAAHGINAGRLILERGAPRAELLAAYQRVDIALDPFPYPGGTTSVEALWMGVPVLTLAGERFLSHIGESILQNTGLPEWIAGDHDDYVARAASRADDLQYLAALRNGLRQQVLASPIFDAPRFAHHFETVLRGMWQKWCDQQQGQPYKPVPTVAIKR